MNRGIDDAMLHRAFSAARAHDDAYKGHPTQELIRVILSAALEVQDHQKLRTSAVTRSMVRSAMAASFCGHRVDDALASGTDWAEEVLQAAIEAALAHDDAALAQDRASQGGVDGVPYDRRAISEMLDDLLLIPDASRYSTIAIVDQQEALREAAGTK